MFWGSHERNSLQFSGNTPALNSHLDIVHVFHVKPDSGPVTLGFQPPTKRLLTGEGEKMGMPDHQEFDSLGRFGCHPDFKQFSELVDGTHGSGINLERFQLSGVSGRILVPYPNHFTIIHWFVE
jgi:hypothetical protein